VKRLHRKSFGKRAYHSLRAWVMPEKIVRRIAGILFTSVGFIAVRQTPAGAAPHILIALSVATIIPKGACRRHGDSGIRQPAWRVGRL
jgi:hypothetical protein